MEATADSTTERLTVAHVVLNLDIGGLERIVISLIKNSDPGRFRHLVYCIGSGGTLADELRNDGFPVTAMNKPEGRSLILPFKLMRMFRREKVQVVHSHNYGALVYGEMAAKLAGVAGTVYTSHGRTSAFQKINPYLVKYFNYVNKAVGVSEDTQQLLMKTSGFPLDRTMTIINGLDVNRYGGAVDIERKKEALGLSGARHVVGIVARLSADKDHQTLLEAYSLILAKRTDITLLIVGDGPLKNNLLEKSIELKLGANAVFLGDRLDVPEILKVLDLFVLSSVTEGLAVTLLEAMASELPIVATEVGGNPEVVIHDKTGIIVPPRDPESLAEAICWMIDNREEAAQMGRLGRERVIEHFSIESMVRQYEAVYEGFLKN
jgi:sugar transferase (PEP-CTERM/EpsH1 system associated)